MAAANWQLTEDSEGKKMYFNAENNEATYDRPTPSKPVQTTILPPWKAPMPQPWTKGPRSIKRLHPTLEENNSSTEVRLPLGEDRYATVSVFKGKLYIHIREFFFNQEGRPYASHF